MNGDYEQIPYKKAKLDDPDVDNDFLDDFIYRLRKAKNNKNSPMNRPEVLESEIKAVLSAAKDTMLAEPMLLKISPPVNLCGDIHGQFVDLLRLFNAGGSLPGSKYLFLGDYVDRGKQSVEVITLLLAYKVRYPKHIHLLRGNHESKSVNKHYTFYTECVEKYSKSLYQAFSICFNYMPVAAIVAAKIFCVHGGISPELKDVNQIYDIRRPTDIPSKGLLCDLLWADPSEETRTWQKNKDREISYIFGEDAIAEFLYKNKFELICRAHEVAMKGYQFFKKKRQLVTLFSAPKYDGYNNRGAIMVVSANTTISFKTLR